KAGGKGDVSRSHLLWSLAKGNNVSSPVYHQGHIYWAHDANGKVYCVNAEKGTLVFEERLDPAPGRIYASPLLANGKIYFVSRESGTYVIEANPQFKQVAHN